MFSARLLQFFPWLIVKTLNVFLCWHLLMCFFPFSFPFRVWMNPSMTTKQVSAVCLSVWLSVHRSVSVLSLNSQCCCLFDCSATMFKRGLSAGSACSAPHEPHHARSIHMHGCNSRGSKSPRPSFKSSVWRQLRHSHFGLQRRVTPNTNVALVSTHLTKHKFVLSVASVCSAGVIMQAWYCQSRTQGEWCAKAYLFYARAAWTQPGAAASEEGALLCPCSTLPWT